MNVEDLENPDWVPDEVLTCPSCQKDYPFQWNSDEEVWWPGQGEWWTYKAARFICSRRCYLNIRLQYGTEQADRGETIDRGDFSQYLDPDGD